MKKPTHKDRRAQAEKDITRIKNQMEELENPETIRAYERDGIDVNDIKTALEVCLRDAYRALEENSFS